ncbi:MAG: FecR domain-containing protein [Planctomycetes bacterium]|nr:FecR domain-containing protein [Planctomycetota bacterium]
MTREPCPSEQEVIALAEGRGGRQAPLVAHVADCAACRGVLADVAFMTAPQGAARPVAGRTRRAWIRAAAAVLLLSVAVSILSRVRPRLPGGIEPVRVAWRGGGAGEERFGPGQPIECSGEALRFPDGTVVRGAPAGVVSLGEPTPTERLHLRLQSGGVDLSVARAAGEVTVETGLGEVRVLGTRFSVRLHPPWEEESALLEVEVHEGRVAVRGPGGRAVVETSQRAYLEPGGSPRLELAAAAAGPYWAERLSERLDRVFAAGSGPGAARLVAMLRHQGGYGVREAVSRVEDVGLPEMPRVRWFRALCALDPAAARDLCDRHQAGDGGPEGAPPSLRSAMRSYREGR